MSDAIPTATIDKLADTWQATSELCAGLTEEDWKRPTDLVGWTVQDNLSHLVGTECSLQGLAAADRLAAMPEYVKNGIGEFNESEVESRRGRTGAEVLAEWNAVTQQRLDTLRHADADYFAQPVTTPTGPGTIVDFLDIRILDCWVHEQDMRRALGRPGHLDGPAAEHTIDRLVRTLPIVVGKRAATPEGGAVVIDITGPVHRHLVCEVQNGRAKFVDSTTSDPLATVKMDTETFVVLANGRRTAQAMADRIELGGDRELAQRVVDNCNMMI
jgi:uncharacterized protein (TIGR03083 family)